MNVSQVQDLHRVLIADILDLRVDILAKTERLLDLLGSSTPEAQIITSSSTSTKSSPTRALVKAFDKNAETTSTVVPDLASPEDEESKELDIEQSHASLAPLGLRLSRADYTIEMEGNNTKPPVFDKDASGHPKNKLIGNILKDALSSSIRSLYRSDSRSQATSSQDRFNVRKIEVARSNTVTENTSHARMSSPNAKTRHKFSPDPSPVARLRHQFQPEAKKPEASHVEIGIINEKYKLPNVTQQLSTKNIVASSNERINQEKGGNSEFQLGKSGRPSESTDTVDSMFNAYTFSAKKQKSTPQANSTLQPNRYVPSSKPPSALRRGSLLHSENSIAPPGTNVRRSPSIQSSAISDADKSSTIARNRPVYEIKEVTVDFSSFPLLYRISFWFMLPSFDGKGKRVAATFFEAGDLESIEFRKHGLHPKSWFNTGWDFILSLAYFVCLWVIPFVICFDLTDQVVLIFRILLTTVFLADSIVTLTTPQPNFPTTVFQSFQEYESNRPSLQSWIMLYLKRNLLLDIITVIPFDLFLVPQEHTSRLLLFLLRLPRFYRLPEIISRCPIYIRMKLSIEERLGTGVSKTLPIVVGIFFFIHFNACSAYYAGRETGFEKWELAFPDFRDWNVFEVYTSMFFLAVGNLFPTAWKPQTAVEQIVAVVYIVVGAVLYAGFVGYISSAAMSINPSGRLYNQKMEELIDYVKWKKLSDETKEKLISYYEIKYRGKYFEEDALLADMNDSLREEISSHNTRKLIEKVPFLRREEGDGRDDIFFNKMSTILHARYFVAGDFITKQGDSGNDMFFILSGKVNVYVNGQKVVSLYDGSYIGEVSLITKVLRTATVQAAAPSILYRLTRHDFHLLISEFPDMKRKINMLSEQGQKILQLDK